MSCQSVRMEAVPEKIAPDTPPAPGRPIRVLGRVAAGLIFVSGALAGLILVPPVVMEVGPTIVSARSSIGRGETSLRVPALGTVSAATHRTPLRVEVAITQVDVEQLGDLATSPRGRDELRVRIEQRLGVLARRAALQAIGGAAVVGAIVALIIFHRRWLWVAAGIGVGATSALILMLATAVSYRVEAFEDPTFHGPIGRARTVIEAVGKRVELLDQARSRYETAAERMSELFVVLGRPYRDPRASETVILHASDIHGNPLAFDFIEQLVQEFEADAVVDTGDISSSFLDTGELSSLSAPIDRALIDAIERLNVPYIFIGGNHDSPFTLGRLRSASNVQVLHRSIASIGEVDVFGWGDPTYSTTPIPEDEKSEMRADEAPEVARSLDEIEADVLAIHDSVLGQDAVGDVPVIIAGHTHERQLEIVDASILLTVGSTGATGLKSLTLESNRTYDAELLYFEGEDLVAVDYVQLQNLEGDFTLDRKTF